MSKLFCRLFIKNYSQTNDPRVRQNYGTFASIVGIIINLILAAIKFFAGFLAGSVSIIADAFNNLSDSGTSIITLISFKLSSKPADKEHPFGHARIEYIASMIVSFFIIFVGGELLIDSLKTIFSNEAKETDIGYFALIILSISIVMKLWLGFFYRFIAKSIDSTVVAAASADSFSDSISTFAVLISSIIIHFTGWNIIDAFVGVCVSIPIIIAGLKILNETKDILLGEGPVDETVTSIENIVKDFPDVIGMHDLMVHNYGPNRFIASFHAEVDGKKDIYYLHDMIDNLERRINDELVISCTIHMDPIVTDDENVNELKEFLLDTMKEAELDLPIHDFRTVIGHTHTNMIFDVVLPFGHPLSEDQIKDKISAAVRQKRANCYCVITVDRG
ncbi:MAG: cation transporter [Ruminococcaceae bacterium]|nr:cation transporter [Oscillospiraceae bacterium]